MTSKEWLILEPWSHAIKINKWDINFFQEMIKYIITEPSNSLLGLE